MDVGTKWEWCGNDVGIKWAEVDQSGMRLDDVGSLTMKKTHTTSDATFNNYSVVFFTTKQRTGYIISVTLMISVSLVFHPLDKFFEPTLVSN